MPDDDDDDVDDDVNDDDNAFQAIWLKSNTDAAAAAEGGGAEGGEVEVIVPVAAGVAMSFEFDRSISAVLVNSMRAFDNSCTIVPRMS
jgi:hypothetical protein